MAKADRIEYGEITNLHIFRGDTNQTKGWTEAKLKKIVENFSVLKESPDARLVPNIKISHDDAGQAAFATSLGVLGFGFVERLRKVGRDLYADLTKVPTRILEALKSGELSPQPSVELYRDFRDSKGVSHGPTMTAVSFLIGQQPAVKGLTGEFEAYGEKIGKDNVDFGQSNSQPIDTITWSGNPMKKKEFGELEEEVSTSEQVDKLYELQWAFNRKIYDIVASDELSNDEKIEKLNDLTEEYNTLVTEEMTELISHFSEEADKERYLSLFSGKDAPVRVAINEAIIKYGENTVKKPVEETQVVETATFSVEDREAMQKRIDGLESKDRKSLLKSFGEKMAKMFPKPIADQLKEIYSVAIGEQEVCKFSETQDNLNLPVALETFADNALEAAKKNTLVIDFSETTTKVDSDILTKETFADDPSGEKMDAKVKAYQKEHKIETYSEAYDKVAELMK